MDRADRAAITSIVLGNVVTIAVAIWQEWSALLLLWPYWMQSVAIGWYHARRMLALKSFTTDGFSSNGKPVGTDEKAKRETVTFFAIHFGIFHAVYFVFLVVFTIMSFAGVSEFGANTARATVPDLLLTWALGAMFFFSHRTMFRQQLAADSAGKPNLGTMMFLPYLRILPMHLMIILGVFFGTPGLGVLFFGAMKTLADVGMHVVEHRVLRRRRAVA